jgi:hypothetical protein
MLKPDDQCLFDHLVTKQIQCNSFWNIFVEKNAPKLPDLEAKIPEIAIFTQ